MLGVYPGGIHGLMESPDLLPAATLETCTIVLVASTVSTLSTGTSL